MNPLVSSMDKQEASSWENGAFDGHFSNSTPHIVKRASLGPREFLEDYFSVFNNNAGSRNVVEKRRNLRIDASSASQSLTLEVALFFDEAAYRIFAPYMNYDDLKLQDMILAYLNGVNIRVLTQFQFT